MQKRLLIYWFIILVFIIRPKETYGQTYYPSWYPHFSWEKVPVYKMFGDPRLLDIDEAKFIAGSSDFICIEKAHGIEELGAAELGAKYEIERFRELNPAIKTLFYFNSARAWPFTTYSKGLKYGQIEDKFKPFILKDSLTGGLLHRNEIYCFDALNPDFRQWWVNTVATGVRESGANGLFVDQMHAYAFLRPKADRLKAEKAQILLMKKTKKAIGRDKILLLNNAAHIPELFKIGDGFMFEHYNFGLLSKENIVRDWELMKKISDAGKFSVWRIGVEHDFAKSDLGDARMQDPKYDSNKEIEAFSKDLLDFYLTAFLIGAREYSYFQYGWGWRLVTGPLVDYPELGKPLGRPLGECKKESEWVFTRDFEHAKVWVDLENRNGKIIWD